MSKVTPQLERQNATIIDALDHQKQASKHKDPNQNPKDQGSILGKEIEITPPAHDQNPRIIKHAQPIPIPEDHLDIFLGPPRHLNSEDKKNFRALSRDINTGIIPEDIIERIWVRDICGFEMRLHHLRCIREAFIQSHYDTTLAFILIGQTKENILDLLDRMKDGDEEAHQTIEDLKAKFLIKDDQVRHQVEIRFRDQISKIDNEMRQIEQARDRVIDQIEKRRFIMHVNDRMKKRVA